MSTRDRAILGSSDLEPDYEKIHQHKEFSESGWEFKGRPNVIGILKGEPSAKSLILNGHDEPQESAHNESLDASHAATWCELLPGKPVDYVLSTYQEGYRPDS